MGAWGQSPQLGPEAEPLVGVREQRPLKLKAFSLLGDPLISDKAYLHPLRNFEKSENHIYL